MILSELFPDSDALLELEPEELAGILLQYLNSQTDSSSGQLNRYNFSLDHTFQGYPQNKVKPLSEAFMEAWIWAQREGFIAPKPQQNGDWIFITRRGRKINSIDELQSYRNADVLPRKILHPIISQKVWAPFLRGDYDSAVFLAFRELEIFIRDCCQYDAEEIGVTLVRKAFNKDSGPLSDMGTPVSEREALSNLFAGAIGSYKNPHSHRHVRIGIEDALETILLASHLYRIVESRASEETA